MVKRDAATIVARGVPVTVLLAVNVIDVVLVDVSVADAVATLDLLPVLVLVPLLVEVKVDVADRVPLAVALGVLRDRVIDCDVVDTDDAVAVSVPTALIVSEALLVGGDDAVPLPVPLDVPLPVPLDVPLPVPLDVAEDVETLVAAVTARGENTSHLSQSENLRCKHHRYSQVEELVPEGALVAEPEAVLGVEAVLVAAEAVVHELEEVEELVSA
jgi:hypothetical protein